MSKEFTINTMLTDNYKIGDTITTLLYKRSFRLKLKRFFLGLGYSDAILKGVITKIDKHTITLRYL